MKFGGQINIYIFWFLRNHRREVKFKVKLKVNLKGNLKDQLKYLFWSLRKHVRRVQFKMKFKSKLKRKFEGQIKIYILFFAQPLAPAGLLLLLLKGNLKDKLEYIFCFCATTGACRAATVAVAPAVSGTRKFESKI